MKILHISDTHGKHEELTNLPEADVIVHSGDFTMAGTEQEVMSFLSWFFTLPYKYKVFVCGNHDCCLYGASIDALETGEYYLCNSGVEIEGYKFYGVPMFMEDVFSGDYDSLFGNIPADTDVLITHEPPKLSDKAMFGSKALLDVIDRIKPKAHLFGHDHNSFGTATWGPTILSNAAMLDHHYNKIHDYNLLEI